VTGAPLFNFFSASFLIQSPAGAECSHRAVLLSLLPGGFNLNKSKQRRHCSLQFETLEPRQVMAAGVLASLSSGVLNLTGTNLADSIAIRQGSKKISIAGVSGSWSATKVMSIAVQLQGGNDYISLDSVANGGAKVL
jgi:hypothetical protein